MVQVILTGEGWSIRSLSLFLAAVLGGAQRPRFALVVFLKTRFSLQMVIESTIVVCAGSISATETPSRSLHCWRI